MKMLESALDLVREFDLFAPHIGVRYKSDNDFKTLTGAILSLALIIFFGVVFINRFTTMVSRTEITSSVLLREQTDPSFYNTSTSSLMFAVGVRFWIIMKLTGLDMNKGNRYFNWYAQSSSNVNGVKAKLNLTLVPCTVDMWSPLGENFVHLYNKMAFSKWLCPAPEQLIQLQGKFSSDIFRYIKIYLKACSGTSNGQGCRTQTQINNYILANEVFSFNFYFVNSLVNPDEKSPENIFLDDTNNFPFSITTGTSCNFFIQSYTINTDHSLMPYEEIQTVSGGKSPVPAQMTTYIVSSSGQYLRFYIRKSPTSEIYTRTFFRFDDLLSYIGGLFGLIAMLIQLPLTYYNICCFELSLATELFTYQKKQKKKDKSKQLKQEQQELGTPTKRRIRGKTSDDFGSGVDLCNIEPRDPLNSANIKEKNQIQHNQQRNSKEKESLAHSIDNFNFFTYLGYIPFFALKRFGWKSLKSERFTPYYEAIKQVRRQIDLGGIIQRFLYLDRVSKSVLDEDQRKLLHIYPKENIYQMDDHRSGFKLREKIKQSITKNNVPDLLSIIVPEILGEKPQLLTEQQELRKAYQNLCQRHDLISERIIQNLDPDIAKGLLFQKNHRVKETDVTIMMKDSGQQKRLRKQTSKYFKSRLKTRRQQIFGFKVKNDRGGDMHSGQEDLPQPFDFINPDNDTSDNRKL